MPFHFTIPQASIQDTLSYIRNFVNRYSTDDFTIKLMREFDTEQKIKSPFADNSIKDKKGFIKRLFDYICENGYYQLDKDGEEEIWTPAKIISTRNAAGKFQYDCKKISILIGSVLKAAGIDPVLKHVYYSDGIGNFKDFTHIYIVVPTDNGKYITVDPTNDCQWDTEVPHDKATLYFLNGTQTEVQPMNLHLIGNNNKPDSSLAKMFSTSAGCVQDDMNAIVGCPPETTGYSGVGLKNDYFSYTVAEKGQHIAAVGYLAIPRNAFLGLLYLGKLLANTSLKLNWASRLAAAWNKNKPKVRKTWWLLGGAADATALKNAINKGQGTNGIKVSGPDNDGPIEFSRDHPIDLVTPHLRTVFGLEKGIRGPNSIGVVAAATVTAIAASTPIIIKLLDMLKSVGVSTAPDPPIPETTPPPSNPPGGAPSQGNMLDFSSPLNTIVKSIFLMGVSGISSGMCVDLLNSACVAAIIYSVTKFFKR